MAGYSIAAMGDVMLDRTVGERFRREPDAFRLPRIAALLEPYDVVFANLENPVATGGTRDPIQNPNVCFRAHPDTLDTLEHLGVNAVSIGNNHALDYGPDALAETLRHLEDRGIAFSGAGRDYEEANRPLELEVADHRIAIFSRCFVHSASTRRATRSRPGVADYRIGSLLPRIRDYRARGWDVHVSAHWGIEYEFFPLRYQAEWARRMIDAGATLIIGHGPHYPQGFENHGRGRIVYSLGNFVFDEPMKFANRSFLYGTRVENGSAGPDEVHPVHLEDGLPRLLEGRERERMLGLLGTLTRRYTEMTPRDWQAIDNIWFQDMVWRTQTMQSARFFRLPPFSFYRRLGLRNYLRKLLPGRFKAMVAP